MYRNAILAATLAAGLVAGAPAAQASTAYRFFGFTQAVGQQAVAGTGLTFNVTLGGPFGFGQYGPVLNGNTVSFTLPSGSHSNRWWKAFFTFEYGRIYQLVQQAGKVTGGGGGAGVPGPVAGAGLPALAAAALVAMVRRRRQAAA